ncbi:unnamed protein product [Arabidopsis thaliana]|uniref:(thale cress) hypothetical protein n=1 Tax=Arabidopsis thaliana TaxID=3702 RepID=A0A7G2DT95_ARATH|nr:unnamed protein product [Arabidopsis thaliana]
MDLMVSTSSAQEGFCLIQQFHREYKRGNKLDVSCRTSGSISSKIPLGSRKRNRLVLVSAASKVESSGLNGRAQKFETLSSGYSNSNGNGHYSSVNSSFALEDVESNNHLRQMVRTGELEEGFKFLENMVYHGNVPDIIPCTTLIRGFCRLGKTRKAAKILEILEGSGAVPDVITYNVMISGKGCSPVLITYNTVIDGLAKAGKTGKAIKLLDEMRAKDLKPDTITYSSLVGGLSREGKVDEAIKFFHEFERMGIRPNAVTFNSIMLGLCKSRQTDRAIDFLVFMINRGCKPNETSYTILIEGLAYEGMAKEALELLNELCNKGLMKKSSAEQVAGKM